MNLFNVLSDTQFLPDVFETTMFVVVDDFKPPCRRIRGDEKLSPGSSNLGPIGQRTKLFRFPRFNLRLALQHTMAEIASNNVGTLTTCTEYPAPRGLISHFSVTVRYVNHRREIPTYEPPSLSEISCRTTTHAPRVYLDIKESLSVNVLDLVGPWLQFSIYEDG